jgi:hypothetical protein
MMNMMTLASGRSRAVVLRIFAVATVAGALVLGAAGLADAGSPVFDTTSLTAVPGNVAIPYSTSATPTYVQYEVKYARSAGDTSALTHASVSQPVTQDANHNPVPANFPVGSMIVSVTGCPSVTYRNSQRGLTCDFGTLRQGAVIDLTIVVQTPSSGATAMTNMAVLTFKEGTNDSQPQSSFTDSVFTNPITTQLTTDTTNTFNTFTLPATTSGSFLTASGGTGNYQQSGVTWSGVTGFPGGRLQLQECGGPKEGSPSCPAGTANPCAPLTCGTQTSIVVVPGTGTVFSQQNPLTITLTFFAAGLPAKFNLSQFVIYHDGYPVSSCKARTQTDPSGDCVLSLTQSKTTGDVTAVVVGPANGGWGGI